MFIFGGDLNVALNPDLDASDGKSVCTYRVPKRIKKALNSLQLMDTWRVLLPKGRDYTFYSNPRNIYTQAIFLCHREIWLECRMPKEALAPFQITLRSRHHSFSRHIYKDCPPWRLDATLLTDPLALQDLTETLEDFFARHADTQSTRLNVWKVHKCTMRGELIALGARMNKHRGKKQTELA